MRSRKSRTVGFRRARAVEAGVADAASQHRGMSAQPSGLKPHEEFMAEVFGVSR